MKLSNLLRVLIYFVYFYGVSTMNYFPQPNQENLSNASVKQKSVSSCDACRYLAQSFIKGLEETTRLNFEGGDADWERQKLGNYENSELRFIEIQEKLCSDLKSGMDQCYNLAELYEAELESWFFENRKDLFTYLCINHLKVCCPDNTYGPNCVPCPGGIEDSCGGHGKCMNGGTREEPAVCLCDSGYTGEVCDECIKGYYRDITASKLSCKICDKSCKDYCRGPGPSNCEVCADGYSFILNEGCLENEEIEDSEDSLETNQNETENLDLHTKPEILNINSQHSGHQEL